MKKTVVMIVLVSLLVACAPNTVPLDNTKVVSATAQPESTPNASSIGEADYLPSSYTSEDSFVADVRLAKEEKNEGLSSESIIGATNNEKASRMRNEIYRKDAYYRLSEIPSGFEFDFITATEAYVHTLYAPKDTESYELRDCIIIYYQIMPEEYRYPDTWGFSLINGYIRAYANKESYNFTYEGTSFACIDLEVSKLVWWDLDGVTLGMACPPNRTDDEIAAIALSVERIEIE